MTELRGFEGTAAKLYFSSFDDLILCQKEDFVFTTRTRRPPLNKVMPCFLLFILCCLMTVHGVRKCGVRLLYGFFHVDRPGRMSLLWI